jgi:PAS domain S-box-containing protein
MLHLETSANYLRINRNMLKYLAPFPIPFNEPERLKALDGYNILDTLDEVEFDRITELASIICDVPISLVSLVDEKRQWFKSNHGLGVKETDRKLAFCQYAIMDSDLFEVSDASEDMRFFDNPLVTGEPDIRFYAGMPLIDESGYALGTLCVIDRVPRKLSDNQEKALKLLASEALSLIKERRKREELKTFERLFESSNDLLFVGGQDGYFQKVNPTFTKLLGWSNEQLLKTPHFEFLHPDDIAATKNKLDDLAGGDQCINFIQRFRTLKGDYKSIQWTSTPEEGTDRIFGIGRDVTAKLKMEEELRYTREMLEQTNQVARVGGWNYDVEHNKIYWTSVTKQIHGVPPDYMPDLASGINFYKEGESREIITAAVTKGIETGEPWDLQLQIINLQGEEIWIRSLGNVEMADGKCKRLFGTFQDIDDYKSAEQALKKSIKTQDALNHVLIKQIDIIREQDKTIEKIKEFEFMADSVPEMIWTAKADGVPDYYNQHWADYTGMNLEQTSAAGWETVLHPDDVERCLKVWADAVNSGNPYEVEYRFKRAADNVYKWHLGRALPMKDKNGDITKWFGSCTDIDEYKRALDLENKISQFEEFNRIVAHNLRGPAGSISTLLTMLNGEVEDETERASLIAMMTESSDSLIDTLNQLMKVLEVRNNLEMVYDDCDLQDLVTDISKMLKGQCVAKKVVIETDFKCTNILFPKIYLESIFYNMISNAIKYSQPQIPPRIKISSEEMNGQVVLKFKDNGLGLDLEKHGKELFKLNKVFHPGHDSKGVGLFMTKTQIETFGGSINVKSEPNKGCEFTIFL